MNKVEMEMDNMPDELSIISRWEMGERRGRREEEGERRKTNSQLSYGRRQRRRNAISFTRYILKLFRLLCSFFLRNRLLIYYYFITDPCRL